MRIVASIQFFFWGGEPPDFGLLGAWSSRRCLIKNCSDFLHLKLYHLSKLGHHLNRNGALKKFKRFKEVFKSIILTFDISQILIVCLIAYLPQQDCWGWKICLIFLSRIKNPAQANQAPHPSLINPAQANQENLSTWLILLWQTRRTIPAWLILLRIIRCCHVYIPVSSAIVHALRMCSRFGVAWKTSTGLI